MKDPATHQYLLLLLFMLTLTTGLATSTGTSSFWKQKALIYYKADVAQIPYMEIPALFEFTACLDVYYENSAKSTAFSYCDQDEKLPGLGFRRQEKKLEVFHLGIVYDTGTDLQENVWHTVCLKWTSQTNQLEVYVNKTGIYNVETEHEVLMGKMSLVLGAQHTNKGGQITIDGGTSIYGALYNYQMWNYTRTQDELLDCSEGNLISWTKEPWKFETTVEDVQLRCANATVTPTARTTTLNTILGTTTSTRTPIPDNSASTEIFPVATEKRTSITSSPGFFSTSVTQKETSSSSSSDNFIPTTNNISTTGSIPSIYHSPAGLRTTSAVPMSSWPNDTTVQQQSSDAKSSQGTTTSTRTPIPDNSASTEIFPVATEKRTSITSTPGFFSTYVTQKETSSSSSSDNFIPTTNNISTTGSIPSTYHSPAGLRTTSAVPMSSWPNDTTVQQQSSDAKSSQVITSNSTPSTTAHNTPSGVTESPLSSSGTTCITSTSSMKPNNVTFYFVQIRFIISSTDIDEDMVSSLIQSMMNQLLNNTEFAAVQILIIISEKVSYPRYIAKSIVRANSSIDSELLINQLEDLLLEGFTDLQLHPSLIAENVTAVQLAAGPCSGESTSYDDFPYEWPKTIATEKATLRCHTNPNEKATRDCYINIITLETKWGDPNYSKCAPSTFEDLENVIVTTENANYLAKQILNVTKTMASLAENDIRIILKKLSEIIELGKIDIENAKVQVNIIHFIVLNADTSLHLFTNKILNLMEEIGFKMNFASDTANVTADSMALLVVKKFKEMYFTVATYTEKNVEITLEETPPDKAVGVIHLPKSIQDQAEISSSKVQFNFIGNQSLFKAYEPENRQLFISERLPVYWRWAAGRDLQPAPPPFTGAIIVGMLTDSDSKPSSLKLNTYIISASFEGTKVEGLTEPVAITLRHVQENVNNHPVKCVFWDFTTNNNLGGWNTSGCLMTFTNKDYTSCSCNHLTHFGVLLDVNKTPLNPFDDYVLSLLTYVGCGIACLFLGVALVTYGMFKQLRRDYPAKILMNLSFSLLMLNLLFLINNWLSSFGSQGLCISVAALLHYFLLASFTWMGLEAVHMYFAFVKVFNSYIPKYILKLCIAGWGIPLVVVVAVLCVNANFYGFDYKVSGDNTPLFCWIQNDLVFYISVVSYFGVIFLNNISMFIVVLLQIKSLKSTRIKDWKDLFLHDLKNTLSLAFLLGLTWGFVFFAWGPVRVAFLYLFAIFNTLQGFYIFVFHCLIKESVRRHWRMYLCCGRCQLDNYSDWSRLSNADTKYNGRINLSPSDSYQSTRSNNTASTSNASSLSSFSPVEVYEKSYVNGGGIFISSAHTAPLYQTTVYPNNRRILSFLDSDTH